MELKRFTSEIVTEWRKRNRGLAGMAGVTENKENGLKGELFALKKMKKDYPEYEFCQTNNSWTSADIIGFKKGAKIWHFALLQVKTSKILDSLDPEIPEKYTLPVLVNILKDVFVDSDETKYFKNRELYITIGYIGVLNSNGHNKIVLKKPYKKDFTHNKLSLTQSEKTKIKNHIHR